jgi:site-specific recombinase XerD
MPELLDKILKRTHLNLSQNQVKILKKFDEYNEVKNLKRNTRDCELRTVLQLGLFTKKDYEDITKEDVNAWLNRGISPYSRVTYQLYLGKFFKFMGRNIEGWFEPIKNAYDKTIDPSDLWSPEDINNLIKVYPEVQNRALVATLYDSEARVSELCSMNISDVEFRVGNAVIFLRESKTQPRRVELIFSTRELLPWYNIRKAQGQPNEPLWISKANNNRNGRLTQSGVYEILKYGRKLLGINKPCNPHTFRHSMASFLRSQGFPDALHRIRMGLGFNSPVLDRYSHFQDSQIGEGAKKAFGVKDIEEKKEEPNSLLGIRCPRCGTINRSSNELCEKCYYSISYENTALEIELLEMYRTKFTKVANLDQLFKQYRFFKEDVVLLESFKQLLMGSDKINTEVLRRYFIKNFGLTDDGVNYFLESLLTEDIIEIKGDSILVGTMKLDKHIENCKEFLKLDDKYSISKGGEK